MLDNFDIAVLSRLNALAERRGFRPYDFVASAGWGDGERGMTYVLKFEVPGGESPQDQQCFDKMLEDLGIAKGASMELKGAPETILNSLDRAMRLSPGHGRDR